MKYLFLCLLLIMPISAREIALCDVKQVLETYGLERLKLDFSYAAINTQNKNYLNRIDFLTALKMAISSFLNHDEGQSPLQVLTINNGEYGKEILKKYLSSSATVISFPAVMPEGGESQKTNWVFSLHIKPLGDYMFWAIVDRAGVYPTYNYGFN